MTKDLKIKLIEEAEKVAKDFSSPNREFNYSKEVFEIDKIVPLSENTASVTYIKNTGRKGLALFYYINSKGGHWEYFFPKDGHILGLEFFKEHYRKIEEENFEKGCCK